MVTCMPAKHKKVISPPEIKFFGLIAAWSRRIKVEPSRVRFQRMTRKWASCSTAGQITFNFEVLNRPLKFQEAVIVHELVHLMVPNHGKLFKTMFLSFMPEGEKLLKST